MLEGNAAPVASTSSVELNVIASANGNNEPQIEKCVPLTLDDWIGFFDEEGRISSENEKEIRKRIFYGVSTQTNNPTT